MRKYLIIALCVLAAACSPKQTTRTVQGIVMDSYAGSVMVQESDSVATWIEIDQTTNLAECYDLSAGQSILAECVVRESSTGDILTALKINAPDRPYQHYIVGAWVEPNPVAPDQVQGFRLAADGTATSINTEDVVYTSWTLRGNKLVLVCESSDEEQAFEQQIIYTIKAISAKTLTLENESAETFVYSRQ